MRTHAACARAVFTLRLHPSPADANWAVNTHNPAAYARRASQITVMYNYFGHTVFPSLAASYCNSGLARYRWDNVQPIIDHGVKNGLKKHRCGVAYECTCAAKRTCRSLLFMVCCTWTAHSPSAIPRLLSNGHLDPTPA